MTAYTKFSYSGLSRFDVDTFEYVKLPYEDRGKGSKKILFVVDYMPSEDLESGKLLSGVTGDLLQNIISYTRKTYAPGTASPSWLAVSFSAFRTAGKSEEFQTQAREAFTVRLKKLILSYKPDYVVAFGCAPMDALLDEKIVEDDKGRRRYSYWLGNPVERTFKIKDTSHTTLVVSNLSLYDIIRASSAGAAVLGYVSRWLSPAFGYRYHVDGDRLEAHKSVVIKDLKSFKKLMARLRDYTGYVSIDTETKNLNKVTNRIYTIQFATDQDTGYMVPLFHKDTPFSASDLKVIVADLRSYFEDNKNDFHIYVNAKFDLTMMKDQIGFVHYKADIVDLLAEMFALDENGKYLDAVLGEYEYSLGNLSVQYGFEGYLNAEFGKANRKDFGSADLTAESTIHYTTLDVVTPIAIHEQNVKLAKTIKYDKWLQVVRWEIGSGEVHVLPMTP